MTMSKVSKGFICKKCNKRKKWDAFVKNKRLSFGIQKICNQCQRPRANMKAKSAYIRNHFFHLIYNQFSSIYYREQSLFRAKQSIAIKKWVQENRLSSNEIKRRWIRNNYIKVLGFKKNQRDKLSDSYIKQLLYYQGLNNPPKQLIELERVRIELTRQLKQHPK